MLKSGGFKYTHTQVGWENFIYHRNTDQILIQIHAGNCEELDLTSYNAEDLNRFLSALIKIQNPIKVLHLHLLNTDSVALFNRLLQDNKTLTKLRLIVNSGNGHYLDSVFETLIQNPIALNNLVLEGKTWRSKFRLDMPSLNTEVLTRYLKLNNNLNSLSIYSLALKNISDLVNSLPKTLCELAMNQCNLKDKDVTYIVNALQQLALNGLDISRNLIQPAPLCDIFRVLMTNPNLKKFHCQSIRRIDQSFDAQPIRLLCELIKQNVSITDMRFNASSLSEDEVNMILFALMHNTTLQDFSVEALDSAPSDANFENMAALLKVNQTLKSLQIWHRSHEIHAKQVTPVIDCLAQDNKTMLDLSVLNDIPKVKELLDRNKKLQDEDRVEHLTTPEGVYKYQ